MKPVVKAALQAFEQGWAPIPIVLGEKRPAHSDWGNTRYKTKKEIESAFADSNLGLLLGDPSNGLIDIDLDSPEARTIADGILPATRMVHGRESSPRSHYWYKVKGWSLRTSKYSDPLDGAAMVEVRGTGGQTLIPPSVHPSGETYEWFDEWHPPASVPYHELERRVRWLASAALLAKYWPEAGTRHDAALSLAGGLLKLRDQELVNEAEVFVAIVAGAGGDEEWHDRQVDVETTRKRLAKGQKAKGWKSLTKLIPEEVVRQVIGWLQPEEIGENEAPKDIALVRESLAPHMEGEIEPPEMLVSDILYANHMTWLQGEPGKGKTLFGLWLMVQIINEGRRILYFDEENGPRITAERLKMLGADSALVDQNLWYYPSTGFNANDIEHRNQLAAISNEFSPDLVTFDSIADFLANAGLKEDSNDDFNFFHRQLLRPISDAGIAILAIDHVSKAGVESGYARGAGSKKAKTVASWTMTTLREFDQHTLGRASLKRAKDRLGTLPNNIYFTIGGQDGQTIIERGDIIKDLTQNLDMYETRIVEYAKENAATIEDAIPTAQIRDAVKGKTKNIQDALNNLEGKIGETPLEVVERDGKKLWYYAGDTSIDWGMVSG